MMTDDEFDQFLIQAKAELDRKQHALEQNHQLGGYAQWAFEQHEGRLQFLDAHGAIKVSADVILIGSFVAASSSWRWAWANETILPNLRAQSAVLKALAQHTGMDLFAQHQTFAIDGEGMAWELAAMAVKHLGALGCYRGPSANGQVAVFFAMMAVR